MLSKYLKKEKKLLVLITLTGLIYNVGLLLGPYIEGLMVEDLKDIFTQNKEASSIIVLSILYFLAILIVQASRFFKRLYVRKFGNAVNKSLKLDVYSSFASQTETENDAGAIMTKAIDDVDECSEGIRKFTTEVFDTGIALISYITMLVAYDLKLTLFVILFPLISYIVASKLKKVVVFYNVKMKKSAENLHNNTLDRIRLGITYFIYGEESNAHRLYEDTLTDYEEKKIHANIFETSLKPLYRILGSTGVLFIMYFGSKNVMNGAWDIAAFTTYMSCFLKMTAKSSNAAKLFNAVQKAKVSWTRICPILKEKQEDTVRKALDFNELTVSDLHYAYDTDIFSNVNFKAHKGEIIGITGEIASGKTTLGKMFLEDSKYDGSILIDGKELRDIDRKYGVVSYMGHNLSLLDDTIENNIKLGLDGDVTDVLKTVCIYDEIQQFKDGIHTRIGEGGVRLSGGQQARIALARTLFHKRYFLVLDDPFAACDKQTEKKIYENIRREYKDMILLLISHRLYLFSDLDKVLLIDDKKVIGGTHASLLEKNEKYRHLYSVQEGKNL